MMNFESFPPPIAIVEESPFRDPDLRQKITNWVVSQWAKDSPVASRVLQLAFTEFEGFWLFRIIPHQGGNAVYVRAEALRAMNYESKVALHNAREVLTYAKDKEDRLLSPGEEGLAQQAIWTADGLDVWVDFLIEQGLLHESSFDLASFFAADFAYADGRARTKEDERNRMRECAWTFAQWQLDMHQRAKGKKA